MTNQDIKTLAISILDAIGATVVSGRRRLQNIDPDPPTDPCRGKTVFCLAFVLLACLSGTVSTVDIPSSTVEPTVPTVPGSSVQSTPGLIRSEADGSTPSLPSFWISSARKHRAKIHTTDCRYHKMQAETEGAAQRQYYADLAEAQRDHPGCDLCTRCLRSGKQ